MDIKDICLVFRFKDDEQFFPRYLYYNLNYCSSFVMVDDNSASSARFDDLLKNPKCAGGIRNSITSSWQELQDQQNLNDMAQKTGCSHYLYLDIDEVLEPSVLKELPAIDPSIEAVSFQYIVLYPDQQNYITTGIYRPRPRFVLGKVGQDFLTVSSPINGPRVPSVSYGISKKANAATYDCQARIFHFGRSSKSLRDAHYARYTGLMLSFSSYANFKTGKGTNYDHIIQEHPYALLDFTFDI